MRVSPTSVLFASCALLFLLGGVAAQANPKLRIGMTIPEVGTFEDEAGQIHEAIETWMKRFNETNGIMVNGTQWGIELVIYNDGADSETAALLYQHMIEHDDIDILLSPFFGPVLLGPTAAVANAFGVPLINYADANYFRYSGGQVGWIFTTIPEYDNGIEPCLNKVYAQGARTVCVSTTPLLSELTAAVPGLLQTKGFTILSNDILTEDNIEVIGEKWGELHPELIVGGIFDEENALLVDTFFRHGGDKNFQGMVLFQGANNENFRENSDWQAVNALSVDYWAPGMGASNLADFWDPYFSTAATPDGSRAYELAFIADHGDPPDTLEVAVAHALEVAVLAFNVSQSTEPEALRLALLSLNVSTIMGRVTFDSQFHKTQSDYRCLQYQQLPGESLDNVDLTTAPIVWPARPEFPKCWPKNCPGSKLGLILGLSLGLGGALLLGLLVFLLFKFKYHIIFIGRNETAASDQW